MLFCPTHLWHIPAVIICAHAHAHPQVATHQCMLNHTWSCGNPPLTLVGGCYKQSWAPLSPFWLRVLQPKLLFPPAPSPHHLFLRFPAFLPLFIFFVPSPPLTLPLSLVPSSSFATPFAQLLSCCILDPSVGKKSDKSKAEKTTQRVRQEHTTGFKLDPGVMPDYLAVGFHLIQIATNKEENKLMGLFGCFSFLSTSAGASTLTLYEHTLAASTGSFSCFGAVVK